MGGNAGVYSATVMIGNARGLYRRLCSQAMLGSDQGGTMISRYFLALWLALAALPANAAGVGGMFGAGRTQFSLVAGNAYAFDYSYFVIGGSVSHYLADGLGVGLSLENWSGDGPGITKYSPFVQYVFHQVPMAHPYLGGFYRRTDIEGLPGIGSTGARAGVMLATGANAYVSFGVVYEAYQDCQEALYRVCSETNPEVSIVFAF